MSSMFLISYMKQGDRRWSKVSDIDMSTYNEPEYEAIIASHSHACFVFALSYRLNSVPQNISSRAHN